MCRGLMILQKNASYSTRGPIGSSNYSIVNVNGLIWQGISLHSKDSWAIQMASHRLALFHA